MRRIVYIAKGSRDAVFDSRRNVAPMKFIAQDMFEAVCGYGETHGLYKRPFKNSRQMLLEVTLTDAEAPCEKEKAKRVAAAANKLLAALPKGWEQYNPRTLNPIIRELSEALREKGSQ